MAYRGTLQQVSKKKPHKNFTLDLINLQADKETKLWDSFNGKNLLTMYFPVLLSSGEACKISSLINKNPVDKIKIHKIYRIQNPYLMSAFLLKKEALMEEYGYESVHSRLLLSVTNMNNLTKLVKNNFDFLHSATEFGKGVCFTTDAKYALGSCSRNSKVIIISNVLVCRSCTGSKSMVIPHDGCDVSLSKDKNVNIVVKYDDNTCYPAYVVYLEKEKSVYNEDLVINLINVQNRKETKLWNMPMDLSVVKCFYTVQLNSVEGQKINSLILDKTMHAPHKIKIAKILRIQNQYIMASFLVKKNELQKEFGQKLVQSRLLLHGTKFKKIDGICTNNFNLNLSKRSLFGKGIYFGTDIAYVQHFCDGGHDKCLIVSNVLVSRTCEGFPNMCVPKENCDTSMSKHKNKDSVIVKYDDNTYYPAYIVYFNFKN